MPYLPEGVYILPAAAVLAEACQVQTQREQAVPAARPRPTPSEAGEPVEQ